MKIIRNPSKLMKYIKIREFHENPSNFIKIQEFLKLSKFSEIHEFSKFFRILDFFFSKIILFISHEISCTIIRNIQKPRNVVFSQQSPPGHPPPAWARWVRRQAAGPARASEPSHQPGCLGGCFGDSEGPSTLSWWF